jgi:hypothetical protein
MSGRLAALLILALLVAGCAAPAGSGGSSANEPTTRCLDRPQRSQSYGQDRPLFFLLCVQSP